MIIEKSQERCQELAEILPDAMIIHGDGTNKRLLMEENLENAEAFVTLTNMDEENILLTLFARDNSKAKLVTKVNRISFDHILDQLDLGSIIYPKYITTDYILQFTRATENSIGSNVETLYHILDNKAEALEFIVRDNAALVGIPLKELKLKDNLLYQLHLQKGRLLFQEVTTV